MELKAGQKATKPMDSVKMFKCGKWTLAARVLERQ